MPIIVRRVESSFIPAYFKKILMFGREHNFGARNGNMKQGSIIRRIIEFILDLRSDADVDMYLKRNGGTFLDLIRRAVKKYVST